MYNYTITTKALELTLAQREALDVFGMAEAIQKRAFRKLQQAENACPEYQKARRAVLASDYGSPELSAAVGRQRELNHQMVEFWNWLQASSAARDLWARVRALGVENPYAYVTVR